MGRPGEAHGQGPRHRHARRASNEPPFLDEREEEAPAERRRGRRGRCRRARRCHRVRECDRARAVGSSGRAYLAVRGIFAAEHRGVACVVRAPPRERVRVLPGASVSGGAESNSRHPAPWRRKSGHFVPADARGLEQSKKARRTRPEADTFVMIPQVGFHFFTKKLVHVITMINEGASFARSGDGTPPLLVRRNPSDPRLAERARAAGGAAQSSRPRGVHRARGIR